jgi:hypothetical protein
MKTKILVVDLESAYEPVTEMGCEFRVRKYVYPYLRGKEELSVIALFGEDATRTNFAPACGIRTVDFITGLGHGNVAVFTGHEHEELWRVGNYNSQETRGKIIHLLSCLTAQQLGYDLVDKGALAYFGYREEFVVLSRDPGPPDITEDPIADSFFKCDSEIDRLIADGHQASEVYEGVMELYERQIEELAESYPEVAKWLRHDMQALRVYGDLNVSLPKVKEELELGKPVSGKLPVTGSSKIYSLKGVERGGKLVVDLEGPNDVNFDLYIRYELEPTLDKWDYKGCAGTSKEKITIDPSRAGDYYILVYSCEGSGLYTLLAGMEEEAEQVQIGVPVSAALSEGEAKYYMVKEEEVGKELIINLEGPSGKDFDLYLRYGLKPNWTEWDDKGYTATSNETVRAYPTKTGNYYIMIHAHSGSGDYTLKASH